MRDDELLDALGAALRDPSPPEPDPARVERIRAAAAARPAGSPRELAPPRPARRWLAVAAASAVVALGAGVAVGALLDDDDGDGGPAAGGVVEYAGPISGPGDGEGDLTVVMTGIGRVIGLETDDLAILPTGEYYEVWFVAPDDRPGDPNRISAGTFHPDAEGRTDVVLAAAVDPALYPVVQITSEPGDGDPGASGAVVLETTIAP